jgi:enoyl-CoA hydratase/carnithine racemase
MAEDRIEVDTGTSELLCEIRGRVALITLNRPEARNALSDRLTPALRRMIKQCGDDPKVGALLITGAGNAFCAGGDVKGMGSNAAKAETTLEQRVAELRVKQRTLTGALVAVRKPTIAALPGPAAGAGLALALACDIRIAAESAIMATGYIRIGLTGGLWHRMAADATGRNIASAGADVPVGADRRAPLRDARSRQPRCA